MTTPKTYANYGVTHNVESPVSVLVQSNDDKSGTVTRNPSADASPPATSSRPSPTVEAKWKA